MKARHASSHFGASQHAYSQKLHGPETVRTVKWNTGAGCKAVILLKLSCVVK
jgi:hypothetical protein